MTALVTGGAGFIGSALVRALIRDGQHVVTVDKLTYAGNLANLAEVMEHPRHCFVQADIADGPTLGEVLSRERPAIVYHLAAETHVDRSIDAPAAFIQTNIVGTAALLQASQDFWRALPQPEQSRFRLISVSTDEVFGDLGFSAPAATEAQAYRPSSPYAASKAAADHLCRAWHRTYGLPVIVTNCSNNYGPFQFPEKLIPTAILAALENRPIPVYARGDNVRDWLHVDDHVTALCRIGEAGTVGQTYLIGARNERSNIDLIRSLCRHLDSLRPAGRPYEQLIRFTDDRPGHDLRYAIDPGKLERELGWRPRIGFDDGLRDTIAWYLENGAWCETALARGGRLRRGLGQDASR
jgi:dTDP-glucose 4,6-dehydratase